MNYDSAAFFPSTSTIYKKVSSSNVHTAEQEP